MLAIIEVSYTYYNSSLWGKNRNTLSHPRKAHKHVCCIGKPGISQTATGTGTTTYRGSLGLLLYIYIN